ncbi:MAG: hypothetical protein SNJ56_05980, partial [Termitinemataceae bacterium]
EGFRNAVLEYPVVRSIRDKRIQEAVNALIGPAGQFEGLEGTALQAAFSRGESLFDEARAEVAYNGRGILQVIWQIKSTGAYTSEYSKTVTVDTRNGALLGSEYMFVDDLSVSHFVQSKMAPLLEKKLQDLIAVHPEEEATIRLLMEELEYRPDMLFDAILREDGMVFTLTGDFPQAFKELDSGNISLFIPWQDLYPFSYQGSILERFPEYRQAKTNKGY